MGIGGVEGCDGPDEELPSSEDSPPEEDGDESGGEGGIPDPPAPRIGISVGLVVFSPNGFGADQCLQLFSDIREIKGLIKWPTRLSDTG
jgi:hypothetical protein